VTDLSLAAPRSLSFASLEGGEDRNLVPAIRSNSTSGACQMYRVLEELEQWTTVLKVKELARIRRVSEDCISDMADEGSSEDLIRIRWPTGTG
jgi:hypothetical protein